MSNPTRRGFLTFVGAGAAVAAGAAALGATSTSALSAPAATTPDVEDAASSGDAQGSLTAYVHDLSAGEVTLMLDGHEVVVQDRALVAKLAKASASSRA